MGGEGGGSDINQGDGICTPALSTFLFEISLHSYFGIITLLRKLNRNETTINFFIHKRSLMIWKRSKLRKRGCLGVYILASPHQMKYRAGRGSP